MSISTESLQLASETVLEKLAFDYSVGNVKNIVTPDEYAQMFRDVSDATKQYQTKAEVRLDTLTQTVIKATDEISLSLEKAEAHLNAVADTRQLINTIRESGLSTEQLSSFELLVKTLEQQSSCLIASQREVLNSKSRVHELEIEVSTDHLTQAKNRVALDKKLAELEASKTPCIMIQCDLDFFKCVNDTFGHAAGDEVLQVFTKRVHAHLKTTDSLFRSGGDEFVLLLEGASDEAQIKKITGRLKAAISSDPVLLHGREVPISSSMGGAVCKWDSDTAKADAIHAADQQMYKDKASDTRARIQVEMSNISLAHTGKVTGFRV